MNKLTMLTGFSILSGLICLHCLAQTTEVRVLESGHTPPVDLVPEPGDKVYIDPTTNDVVAESRGLKRVIVRTNNVAPVFAISSNRSAAGAEYSFTLQNGLSAKQWVLMFIMELPDFVQMANGQAPKYWKFWGVLPRDTPLPTRASWGRTSRDDDETLRLIPGSQAGPFTFTANAWPGLTMVRVLGQKPFPPEGQPSDESDIQFMNRQSEWALENVKPFLSWNQNTVPLVVLGPKIQPSANILPALQSEFDAAIKMAEFAAYQDELASLKAYASPATLSAKLKSLAEKATGLPKEFFTEMIANLDAASSLR